MDHHIARSVDVLAAFVGRSGDLETTLRDLVRLGVEAIGADMAGLTVRDQRGRPTTAVFTDDAVVSIDQAQYDHGRGPCLDAARTHAILRVDDTAADRRWPEFARVASSNDVRSSLSVPLVVGDEGLGALNIYDRRVAYFEPAERQQTSALFAGQCSIAALYWGVATEATNLAAALLSRATIEQAKGIVMATTGCGADEAFNLLREQSQTENRKLRDIAAEVVSRQKR
jgi:transcriptional regulator with GAF, ATPase, and Fis domain